MESPLSEAIEALGRADEELQAVVRCNHLCCSKEQRYREGTVLAPTLCRFITECKSLPHGNDELWLERHLSLLQSLCGIGSNEFPPW